MYQSGHEARHVQSRKAGRGACRLATRRCLSQTGLGPDLAYRHGTGEEGPACRCTCETNSVINISLVFIPTDAR